MLTERRQQQAIRAVLNGQKPEIDVNKLKDPYNYLYEITQTARNTQEAYQLFYRAKIDEPDIAGIIESILAMETDYKPTYESLNTIGPGLPDVDWLWENWIPRGYLTMLAAWPGIGKTYLALDLARRVIANQPAPDNAPLNSSSCNIIYVDAEDFLPIIHLRANAWAMDTTRFYPLRRAPRDLIDMTQKYYQDSLIDMCYDLRPDLVIVDSLSSVNSKGENSIEDLREILTFFVELPQAFGMALVLIHHLRKPGKSGNGGPITMHDLRGSGHLVAMARSIIGLDIIDPDNPNAPRLLKIIKTNIGTYPPPLSVRFTPNAIDPKAADLIYGKGDLVHLPDTSAGSCAQWLVDVLTEGPKSYQELKDLAGDQFNESAIQRARGLLNGRVVDTVGPQQRGNKWSLLPEFEISVQQLT